MAYLGLLPVRFAADSRRLVLLDEEPYRLERGGIADEFMLPLGLERLKKDGKDEMQDRPHRPH